MSFSKCLKSLFIIIVLIVGLPGCGRKPQKFQSLTSAFTPEVTKKAKVSDYKGLWIALTNYTSGSLARLDLETSAFVQNVKAIGPDVKLAQATMPEFYMLTRSGSDSVTILEGTGATVKADRAVGNFSNPQDIYKDPSGNIWITRYDSNLVEAFSSDLSSSLGTVDLSILKDSNDAFAELSGITYVGPTQIAVSAQRLNRNNWTPDVQGGIGIINTQSKTLEAHYLVNAMNPSGMQSRGVNLEIVGSGALNPSLPDLGTILTLSLTSGTEVQNFAQTGRIVGVDFGNPDYDGADRVMIRWEPENDRSCINVDGSDIVCESTAPVADGWVFSSVLLSGQVVFASATIDTDSELWAIPLGGGAISKVALPMAVGSIALGP